MFLCCVAKKSIQTRVKTFIGLPRAEKRTATREIFSNATVTETNNCTV